MINAISAQLPPPTAAPTLAAGSPPTPLAPLPVTPTLSAMAPKVPAPAPVSTPAPVVPKPVAPAPVAPPRTFTPPMGVLPPQPVNSVRSVAAPMAPMAPKAPAPTPVPAPVAEKTGFLGKLMGGFSGKNNSSDPNSKQVKISLPIAISALALILLVIGGGVAFYLSQQQQEIRQQASGGSQYGTGNSATCQLCIQQTNDPALCTAQCGTYNTSCPSGSTYNNSTTKCECQISNGSTYGFTAVVGMSLPSQCVGAASGGCSTGGQTRCTNGTVQTCDGASWKTMGQVCTDNCPAGSQFVAGQADRCECVLPEPNGSTFGFTASANPSLPAKCSEKRIDSTKTATTTTTTTSSLTGGTPSSSSTPTSSGGSTDTACGDQVPVNTQFRPYVAGTDAAWVSGTDITAAKYVVGQAIDINCFAKNGAAQLAGGYINVTDPNGATTKVASEPILSNYVTKLAGTYTVTCASTSLTTCSDADSFTILAASAATTTAGTNTATTYYVATSNNSGCRAFCSTDASCQSYDSRLVCYKSECRTATAVDDTNCPLPAGTSSSSTTTTTPGTAPSTRTTTLNASNTPVTGQTENTIAMAVAGLCLMLAGTKFLWDKR